MSDLTLPREPAMRSCRRRYVRRGAVAVALPAALLAAAPIASAAWSSPARVGSSSVSTLPAPDVAGNAAGRAVVVWADAGRVRAVVRSVAGTWSSAVTISSASETSGPPTVAMRPDGTAVAAWSARRATDTVIETAGLLASGAWSSPAVLSTAGTTAQATPQVAVDGAGSVQIAWAQSAAAGGTVRWSVQPGGSGWAAPTDVATGQSAVTSIVLSVNARGDSVVGWATGTSGLPHSGNVAVRHVAGLFSAPTRLVTSGGRPIQSALGTFAVAIDPAGRATAAWDTAYAYADSQLADGSWGPVVTLPSAPYASYVSLAVNSNATAVATWVDANGLESSVRPTGGVWATPTRLGATAYPQAALAANGATVFGAWDDLAPSPRPVLGATWTASGSWTSGTILDRLALPYDYTLGSGAIAAWVNAGSSSGAITVSVTTG